MNNNSKKMSVSQKLYRLKLTSPKFWDNVKVKNMELRDHIVEWFSALKYHRNISVDKFSDLFGGIDGIVFPIRVSGFRHHLQIIDDCGNKYYMWYRDHDHHKIDKYSIGIRGNGFDKEFTFKLNNSKDITLQELFLLQLNFDNTNSNDSVSFCYNYVKNTTTVVLETNTVQLEINYPYQNRETDKQISHFLFTLTPITHIDDVFFVLENLSHTIKTSDGKLTITSYEGHDDDKRKLSEICLLDGIVTRYSFSKRADYEFLFYQTSLPEELEKFILSHKK